MSHNINIFPFGMDLSVNMYSKNSLINFCIFLIGPLINILICLIVMSLWWHYPAIYFYTKNFVRANFYLGVFNIIPIYPLDGGNMILELLGSCKAKIKALKIMKIFAICLSIFFVILFILSCFYSINFSCICIASFLFSSIFSYDKILHKEIESVVNKESAVREYCAYVISAKTSLEDISKCFDKKKFVQFYLVNGSNKIIKVLTQEEIYDMYKELDYGVNKTL